MPEPFLAVENVSVAYGDARARCRALRELSLGFEPGSLTLIMGPSGSGKTTLLSLLGCLLKPDQGNVYIEGAEVGGLPESARTRLRRDRIGFVFQAFRLFRSLTALDNVLLSGEIEGGERPRLAAMQLLERLGLGGRALAKPDALSGGEKQRVALARALIKNPSILLADEPTASLDGATGQQIAEILFQLAQAEGRGVVVVSHDPRWIPYAHRVVVLEDGQVVQQKRSMSA